MRKGHKCSIIRENGVFVGVNLGADYCAEHEWGIEDIKRAFGAKLKDCIGVEDRTITKLPTEGFALLNHTFDKKPYRILMYSSGLVYRDKDSDRIPGADRLRPSDRETMTCAWSGSGFAICLPEKDAAVLDDLLDAFKRKDIAMWLGGGGIFENAGLIIAVASRVPIAWKENMKSTDMDVATLKQAKLDTGIEELLKKANKGYFALTPKWKDDEKKELIFWLNPSDQKKNNCGWYTLEDLKLWAQGKGPIVGRRTK